MSYTVIARKYRPESFKAVVGQDWITKALTNAIKKERLAHAFLFSGPRGVGKTSLARILSKALNCKTGPTPEPCLKCRQCKAITSGADVDVLEIDAASNRGIDHIRAIRENVRYAPVDSRFKIYIIDEVHMLTTESFNALLKTLEEPPSHVKFIFATTEPQRMPETVRSRCQVYEFKRISIEAITQRLEEITTKESIQCDPGVIPRIALLSRGGLRDAESLLDQIASLEEGKGTFEGLNALTGRLAPSDMGDLIDSVLEEKTPQILDFVERVFVAGTQGNDLLKDLIDYWRALMLASAGRGKGVSFPLPGLEDRCQKQAKKTDLDRILACLQISMETLQKIRWFDNDRILVETALLKMARISHTVSLAEALERFNEGEGRTWRAAKRTTQKQAAPARAKGSPVQKASSSAPVSAPRSANLAPTPEKALEPVGGEETPGTLFNRIVDAVEKESKILGGYLRRLKVQSYQDNQFLLEDPAEGVSSLYSMDNPDVQRKLNQVTSRLFGKPCRFTIQRAGPPRSKSLHSTIKKTMDLFDGDIV